MANDRQSIMLHENGKKHCLNVEKFLEEKRKNKLAQSKEAKLLQKSLQTMQQVAFEQHIRQDLHHNYYQDDGGVVNHNGSNVNTSDSNNNNGARIPTICVDGHRYASPTSIRNGFSKIHKQPVDEVS